MLLCCQYYGCVGGLDFHLQVLISLGALRVH